MPDYRELIGRFIAFYHDQLFNPHWGETVSFRSNNVLVISLISQGLTSEQAEAIWQPFLDGIKATDDAAQARLQPATIISPHRPKAMTQAAILAHILTGTRD
jgi:hypothetical protein